MLLEAIGPAGRCRGGVVMSYDLLVSGPRINLLYQPHARARARAVVPLLRGRSPTRSVAPKPLRGLGRAFSPAFLGAWVPKNLARRSLVYWFWRRDAARGDRAGWAVPRRRSLQL